MSGWDGLVGVAVDGYNSTAPADMQLSADSQYAEEKSDPWDTLLQPAQPTPSPSSGAQDPKVRQGIIEAAEELGVDPLDLATAISYETGGTFNPTQEGPTTKWGTHRGFIQFGEPQAQENGVDWDDPIGSQLGAGGAVVNYLRKTGVQPGMGLLDIYSAINAGGVGRYEARDAAAGGAPGSVADKVNNQMAEHRRKAQRLLGVESNDSPPAPSGTPPPPDYSRMWLSLGD